MNDSENNDSSFTVLWENNSPSSDFIAQQLQVIVDPDDRPNKGTIRVKFHTDTWTPSGDILSCDTYYEVSAHSLSAGTIIYPVQFVFEPTGGPIQVYSRQLHLWYSETSHIVYIDISDGAYWFTMGTEIYSEPSTSNSCLIPVEISIQ